VPPSTAIIARPPKAAMPDDTKPMERPEAPELSKRGRRGQFRGRVARLRGRGANDAQRWTTENFDRGSSVISLVTTGQSTTATTGFLPSQRSYSFGSLSLFGLW
jgi:hypothetical protein